MSKVTYNTVTLPYPLHSNFQWDFVDDEMGGADRLYRKLDATIQCVVNTDYAAAAGVGDNNSSATAMAKYMVSKLEVPRQGLSISFNGVEMLPKITGPDAKSGPRPQSVTYTLLTNTTFILNFRIIAHYTPVPASDGNVISNRWTESYTIDDHNYSTRRRSGRFIIRSDNTEHNIADNYREQMCILAIPQGFKRESSQYSISGDGLTISFEIVDREVFLQPPDKAFSAEGTYTETTSMGGRRIGECRVVLRGAKQNTHKSLIEAAVAIVTNKVLQNTGLDNNKKRRWVKMENFVITQHLYDNKVGASLRCELNTRGNAGNPRSRTGLIPVIDFEALAQNPFGSNAQTNPPAHLNRGTAFNNTALGILHAAALIDPGAQITFDRLTGLTGGRQPGEG